MTSLSEAYEGEVGTQRDLRRLYLGVGLFLVGALMLVVSIVITTTDVMLTGGTTLAEVRRLGGVLGGLGVPAVFLGVFAVLPSGRTTRAAAVIGASIAILGVGLFWHAYPCQWIGSNCGQGLANLTLPTVGLYFLGTITTFWCLFVGVANFKTRNDPGGTVTMEITRQGETKVVEVDRSQLSGMGGLGFFGDTPDGNVETQTNRSTQSSGMPGTSGTVSDGGASTSNLSSPMGESGTQSGPQTGTQPNARGGGQTGTRPSTQTGRSTGSAGGSVDTISPSSSRSAPSPKSSSTETLDASAETTLPDDAYCGNCSHFDYVRTDDGIQPYCGYYDELMDDMDACEEWTSRGTDGTLPE